jgi:hypothetical protein
MMPNEASKERKPKHDLESIAAGMESEAAEPGMPDFMKDAEALLALEAKRDKMIDQKTELSKAGNVLELKPGTASGALDKEINALQDKVNAVLGKYGKEANAFQVDAYRVGELKDNVADAEAIMRGLEADYKNEQNRDAKAKLERQLEDATAAWQEARNELAGMKDKYVAKEAAAKAELAGATSAEIDAALKPLDRPTGEVGDDEILFKLSPEDAAKPDTVEASLKELQAIEADRVRDELTTPEITSREATAAETKEVMDAVTDEYLESDEFGKGLDEANEKLKKAQEKKARVDAMTKRVDGKLNRIDAAQAHADQLRAEADARRESKRDTLVDEPEMEVQVEELIDEPADSKAEDEFFQKGEIIDAVHSSGKTLENRSAAERRGDANAERSEMALKAESLRAELPGMELQLARAEEQLDRLLAGRTLSAEERRMLDGEKVITPGKRVDAFMSMRTNGGFMEKAKGFFGGLFNKKTRELNNAIDLYQEIRNQHNEKTGELAKIEMQLNPTDRQKEMSRIASENRQGR